MCRVKIPCASIRQLIQASNDTYGLALDEQEDIARERGVTIDREAFEAEMRHQRERARASWKGAEKGAVVPAYQELLAQGRTRFLGYDNLDAVSTVKGMLIKQQLVEHLPAHIEAELVLDQTPFYAEMGGQVGDSGALFDAHTGEKVAIVESTYPAVPGLSVHRIRTLTPIAPGAELRAQVGVSERWSTMRNHTATHLLHAALRQVLGHARETGGQRGGTAAASVLIFSRYPRSIQRKSPKWNVWSISRFSAIPRFRPA